MSWAKLDDGFYFHRKVLEAGLPAVGLFCRGLSYAAAHETDGYLTDAVASELASRDVTLCERLVSVGLWERNGVGYIIHDYLRFNPSAKQLNRQRKLTAKRVAVYRKRNGVTNGYVTSERLSGRDGYIVPPSSSQELPADRKKKTAPRARAWKTVPAGETLTEPRRVFALSEGLTAEQSEREWAAFVDHEFARTYTDVDKRWRRWVREAVRRASGLGGQPALPGRWTSSKTAGNVAAGQEAIRRIREAG